MSEAAELVSAADKLLEKKLYDEAISSYSIAIKLTPTSPTYYIKRLVLFVDFSDNSSTAYQRSNNLEAALRVCQYSVICLIVGCRTSGGTRRKKGKSRTDRGCSTQEGVRPWIRVTHYRISLNGLKRFADSNAVFQLAKKAGSKDKAIDIWIAKNNAGLAKRLLHEGSY
jgi:hypothetical protein